jgi:polysaccharide biosynthesis/export protein
MSSSRLGFLGLLILLAGCATTIDAPDLETLQGQENAGMVADPQRIYPDLVGPGDLLEVRFYPRPVLQESAYQVEVGDLLRIDVAQHPELDRERVTVIADGTISLPLIGRVKAVGRTLGQLSAEISGRYDATGVRNPSVVVSVVEYQQTVRELIDAVASPDEGSRLLVAVSGGEDIELPFILPIRSDQRLGDLRHSVQTAYDARFNGRLEVTVNLRQREERAVYVFGEVQEPGRLPWKRDFTPLTALASAGGFLDTADPSSALLVRFEPNGGYDYWVVNYQRALSAPGTVASRFPLLPNDVIYVPKSPVAKANQFIDQFIRRMLPIETGFGFGVEVPLFDQEE